MRSLVLIFATTLVTGCFSDSRDPNLSCRPGEPGCECAEGQTCDADLECRPPGVCVGANCQAGTRDCVCDGSSCAGALECNENGVCTPPGGASTGSGDPTTTSSTTTTASSGGDTTGGDPAECTRCVIDGMQTTGCFPVREACQGDSMCNDADVCAMDCFSGPDPWSCIDGCCADINSPVAGPAFGMLLSCGLEMCATTCPVPPLPPNCIGLLQ